jgi:2-methylcitrate dehydratase PrpD
MPVTGALADLLAWLWPALDRLPQPVVERARRLWIDTAACAYSGLRADAPKRWLDHVLAGDPGAVPLPGGARSASPATAAMALAVGACWDEACEGSARAHGRPGVPVVAAAWADLACSRPTWQRLWQATVAGYEVAARLGARLRIRPGMHVDGAWSAFGAAVAAVYLGGAGARDALVAIETAASQLPFALLRSARQGANVRNLYLGHSAWLGLQAAYAARAGLTAPDGALDDVIALMLDGAPHGEWIGPGEWLVMESYWKPFAAVRHVHYGTQAALVLRAQGLDPGTIDAIRLTVYPEALQYCSNRAPSTPLAAQFSLSFGVAAGLAFGDLSPDALRAPRFDDPLLRHLEARVAIVPDAVTFPAGTRGAILSVDAGGRRWQHRQDAVTGDPGHEPEPGAVQEKFARYTGGDARMAAWAGRVAVDDTQAIARLPDLGAVP